MAPLKALPRSKAKTAYGLISDVIRAMEEEPKRVDMRIFREGLHPVNGGPACGTVGCFAGWVSILGRGTKSAAPRDPEEHALELLGDWDTINYYTVPGVHYVFNSGGGGDVRGIPGTKAYARSVVKRVRRFQKLNAKALKARKLSL